MTNSCDAVAQAVDAVQWWKDAAVPNAGAQSARQAVAAAVVVAATFAVVVAVAAVPICVVAPEARHTQW